MKTTRGVIPLIAAIVGVAAMSWAFVTGISAALSGGGSGALPYEIVMRIANNQFDHLARVAGTTLETRSAENASTRGRQRTTGE